MRLLLLNPFCIGLLTCLLAGCGDLGGQSIQSWVKDQEALTKPNVKDLPKPKDFVPKTYTATGLTDPFNNEKLLEVLRRMSEQATASVALLAPERLRKKEQLEDYPLDSIAMVGSLQQRGTPVALVRVNGLLYQVKVGNYLGQNFGKIKSISDADLVLREIVQDAASEWIERDTVLQLQDNPDGQ